MRCGWWNRWLHRRKRLLADTFIRPAIAEAALARDHTRLEAEIAYSIFKSSDGQEHWRCACAKAERVD